MDYANYLKDFENKIILAGYKEGILSGSKPQPVPLRPGKLYATNLGQFVGKTFEYDGVLAINYYGFFKLSTGILKRARKVNRIFKVATAMAPAIYFNSIYGTHIAAINEEMLCGWLDFKKYITDLRW